MVAVVLGQRPAGLSPLRHGAGEQARRRITKSFELDHLVASGYVVQKKPGATITECHSSFAVAGSAGRAEMAQRRGLYHGKALVGVCVIHDRERAFVPAAYFRFRFAEPDCRRCRRSEADDLLGHSGFQGVPGVNDQSGVINQGTVVKGLMVSDDDYAVRYSGILLQIRRRQTVAVQPQRGDVGIGISDLGASLFQ